MHDRHRQAGKPSRAETSREAAEPDRSEITSGCDDGSADPADGATGGDESEESLFDEVATLIDDGRTYAQAEIAFQKNRAKFAGRAAGVALVQLVLAIILLHIAFLALAVGLVIALAPMVTVWGAIAIVVGGLLVMVGILVALAVTRAKRIGAAFASGDDGSET